MLNPSNLFTSPILPERVQNFDVLPNTALVSVREISLLSGKSTATLWRDVRDGRLPKPHKIGPKSPRWNVSDIRRFLSGDA
jgi:predicted DNA-binding transcriptional regulator AlpA